MVGGVQFDWDEHNERHIAPHRVEPREVEEVLGNDPIYIESRVDERSGEVRFLELGHTNAGRVPFVAWTARDELTRPVTRSTPTAKPERRIKGNAMKKNNNAVAAEAAFAADLYKDRAAINRKAQDSLATSRQITIRLNNSEIALAKQQAEAKGLKYQTYIKMLLHEALVKHAAN